MNNLLTNILCIIALLGFCTIVYINASNSITTTTTSTTFQELRLERLDGCEYVKFKLGSAGGMTHHGACDNPIHK